MPKAMPLPTLVALWNRLAEATLGPDPRDSRFPKT